jgi:CubicO group peptidase (beta-lactamase class C family)
MKVLPGSLLLSAVTPLSAVTHFAAVTPLAAFTLLAALPLSAQETWPVPDWTVDVPETQGLKSEPLRDITDAIRSGLHGDIHSLLVVRNGVLVWEEYFGDSGEDDVHTLQSVTKSFASAAMGIAMARGDIPGVETPILDFFPDYPEPENLDDRKKAILLEHLLTMRSGTDYHENGDDSPHLKLNALKTGWDRFYLDRPMIRYPGERFQYDSGGAILLSAILQRRTGLHADQYLQKYLFDPMGITEVLWFRNDELHPHTGGGLFARARDMAKFGLLFLRKGRWGDEQLVQEEWVAESFREHVDLRYLGRPLITGYGYLWWIMRPDPDGEGSLPIYAARGFMGQYIFIVPEHQMVVVSTGRNMDEKSGDAVRFLYSHILKAAH